MVVVWAGILRIRILGEDDEPAHIVCPFPQGMEVEGTGYGIRLIRRLHPSEGITVPHAPPTLHDIHLGGFYTGRDRTPERQRNSRRLRAKCRKPPERWYGHERRDGDERM